MSQRRNDPEAMRRKIIDAAFELFAGNGYNATPMHAVRDRAGVSSGAFAHHFPTKHALGMAVLRDRVRDAVDTTWIQPIARAPDAGSGVGRVFDGIIADVDRSSAVSGCPLGNLAAELSTRDEALRGEIHQIFRAWENAIRGKLSTDGCAVDEAASIASLVISSFSGAMLQAKALQSSEPLKMAAGQVRRLMTASESHQ